MRVQREREKYREREREKYREGEREYIKRERDYNERDR